MRTELRRDLMSALKARDRVAVAALRSGLAAIENAEATPVDATALNTVDNEHVAGAVVGVGAGEGERRHLTEDDLQAIIEAEVRERSDAAGEYEQSGHHDAARRLRSEAEVLSGYLPSAQAG